MLRLLNGPASNSALIFITKISEIFCNILCYIYYIAFSIKKDILGSRNRETSFCLLALYISNHGIHIKLAESVCPYTGLPWPV